MKLVEKRTNKVFICDDSRPVTVDGVDHLRVRSLGGEHYLVPNKNLIPMLTNEETHDSDKPQLNG